MKGALWVGRNGLLLLPAVQETLVKGVTVQLELHEVKGAHLLKWPSEEWPDYFSVFTTFPRFTLSTTPPPPCQWPGPCFFFRKGGVTS